MLYISFLLLCSFYHWYITIPVFHKLLVYCFEILLYRAFDIFFPVICPVCRHVSTTFSHFQDLVLDIRNVASVDEALNLHFRKETLDTDNAYKCERCRKKVPATKRHLIERAPHVLLIQLKRLDRCRSWIFYKPPKYIDEYILLNLLNYACGNTTTLCKTRNKELTHY